MDVPTNYWAILVCGIASMVLGFLWFGPLFGKTFMHLVGMDKIDPAHREKMMQSMNKSYALAFIGALVSAYVLSHTLVFAQTYMKESNFSAAVQGPLWIWLGFILPVTLASVLWEGRPWKLWCLNSTYYLVQLLIFGFILTYWK